MSTNYVYCTVIGYCYLNTSARNESKHTYMQRWKLKFSITWYLYEKDYLSKGWDNCHDMSQSMQTDGR